MLVQQLPQIRERLQGYSGFFFITQAFTCQWAQHPLGQSQLKMIRIPHDDYTGGAVLSQIANDFDFYAEQRVMAIADLRGVQIMSSTMTPCATRTPPTCWKQEPI